MDSFFGTPWSDLGLTELGAFLEVEEDEGMTWETKGTERPSRHDVRKAVSGLANQRGGFFIVGVRREARRWIADGVDFGGEEPRVWLSGVIGRGVDPVPWFDVKAWPVANGKHVAVVNVDPVAVPPCVTSSGQVYERLPGKTEPVTAPRLAALFERGELRKQTTEGEALRAATGDRITSYPEPSFLCLRLGVAATGKDDDVSARLFTELFEEKLIEVFRSLPTAPLLPRPGHRDFDQSISQDARTVIAAGAENWQRWATRAGWDGSVVVSLDVHSEEGRLLAGTVFADAVRPAADAAARLIEALGGNGRAHWVLDVEAHTFMLLDAAAVSGEIGAVRPIQVWTDSTGHLDDELLERMHRELLRACRLRAYEPQP
jgi:hypothetical protein